MCLRGGGDKMVELNEKCDLCGNKIGRWVYANEAPDSETITMCGVCAKHLREIVLSRWPGADPKKKLL